MLYMHIGINHSQKKDFFGVVIDDTWSVRFLATFWQLYAYREWNENAS